jgi:hypothetical protein
MQHCRWPVEPCCSGRAYGPGAVRARGAAVPLRRGAPARAALVKMTLHSAFGIGFSLSGGACGGDLDQFIPAGAKVGSARL